MNLRKVDIPLRQSLYTTRQNIVTTQLSKQFNANNNRPEVGHTKCISQHNQIAPQFGNQQAQERGKKKFASDRNTQMLNQLLNGKNQHQTR